MSGLDPRARVLFKKQLAGLKQDGVTVFFSSHVLADVEEMADTMAVLHNSQIYFSGLVAILSVLICMPIFQKCLTGVD